MKTRIPAMAYRYEPIIKRFNQVGILGVVIQSYIVNFNDLEFSLGENDWVTAEALFSELKSNIQELRRIFLMRRVRVRVSIFRYLLDLARYNRPPGLYRDEFPDVSKSIQQLNELGCFFDNYVDWGLLSELTGKTLVVYGCSSTREYKKYYTVHPDGNLVDHRYGDTSVKWKEIEP